MRAVLDLLVPSVCDGCGDPAPPPWCADCDEALRATRPRVRCGSCGAAATPGHPCWTGFPPVDGLVTLGAWTGGVARAVARAKIVGRREVMRGAGARLGQAVAEAATGRPLPGVVVAVPSDRRRARRRGADHTADLAAGAARSLGVPVVRPFAALRGTPDRVAGGGRERVPAAPVPVPAVVRPATVAGRVVLVVDDVVTTGATVAAVSVALRGAGVAGVTVAAVGRAGQHRLRGEPGPAGSPSGATTIADPTR